MTSISGPRKAGHILGIILGAVHLSVLAAPSAGEDSGPPLAVLAIGAVIGLAVIALLIQSWRRDQRGPRRIAAVLLVLAGLGALPGLLVADVPAALQVGAGILVLLTIATVVLLFYPQRDSAALMDAR